MIARILIFLGVLISSTLAAANYEDKNGLVIIEAENLTANANWKKETSFTPYTGTSYIRWDGEDNFSTPAIGLIETSIKINNPGVYRVIFRNRVGFGDLKSEHNDTWMTFPNATDFYGQKGSIKVYPKGSGKTPNPEGASKDGWLKAYSNGAIQWKWTTNTNDGDAYDIFVNFSKTGEYKLQLSGRSKHHVIDRIALYKSNITDAQAQDLTAGETKIGATIPPITAKYKYIALEDFSNLNSGAATFYKDNNFGALAIDPKIYQDKFAKAITKFTGATGKYDITLTTKAEKDGESTYNVYIGTKKIGQYINQRVEEKDDMTNQTITFYGVDVSKDQEFTVEAKAHNNGLIPEGNSTAWSRGRWVDISFATASGNTGTTPPSSGFWKNSRIAVQADGNYGDPDDIAGTPVSLAILRAYGLEKNLVHYTHSCDLVKRADLVGGPWREKEMKISAEGTAEKWGGFDHIKFFNAQSEKQASIDDLKKHINNSTSSDHLWIIEAGEPDLIWEAVNAATPSKRAFVHIVTHHVANDAGDFHNLDDIISLGVPTANVHRIQDQNILLKKAINTWDWAKNHSDPRINWLYERGYLAQTEEMQVSFIRGYMDPSDAGMIYYYATGDEKADNAKLKSLLTQYVDENPYVNPNKAPIVSFINPSSNELTVEQGDHIYVNAEVEDTNLDYTELFINGKFLRKEIVAPFEWGYLETSKNSAELDTLPVGTYTIKVVATDSLGLKGEAQFTLNIEPAKVVSISTNPLSYISQSPNTKISIYNINGTLISETSMKNLNVSELSKGIYFAVVIENNLKRINTFHIR